MTKKGQKRLRIRVACLLGLIGLSSLSNASGETSFSLRWSPSPDPTVTGYNVYYRLSTDTVWTSKKDVGLTTQTQIEAATPGAVYEFAVSSYNFYKLESDLSNVEAAVAPQSATLQWNPVPGDDLKGYRVFIGANPGQYSKIVEVPADQTEIHFQDLEFGRNFYFAVTAFNRFGIESAFSNEVSYSTAPARATSDDQGVFIFYNFD